MAVWTTLILLVAAITFPSNSRQGSIRFIARFPTMIKRGKAIGLKRRALFRGLKKRTRDPPYLLAKTDGSRSAKAIEPHMRSGRTLDHSALIIGNTFSGTNGRSLISTKALAWMFHPPYAITSD